MEGKYKWTKCTRCFNKMLKVPKVKMCNACKKELGYPPEKNLRFRSSSTRVKPLAAGHANG